MSKDNTQKPLMAEEATIQERQITVKVLTIGTKQVTQTLYQQLIEKDPIVDDETAELDDAVTLWGWVNVCTPECKGKTDAHYHIIYEKSGVLRRARISQAFMAPLTFGSDLRARLNQARRQSSNPEQIAELQSELNQYQIAWKRTLKIIEDAGQLFIAVSGVWK